MDKKKIQLSPIVLALAVIGCLVAVFFAAKKEHKPHMVALYGLGGAVAGGVLAWGAGKAMDKMKGKASQPALSGFRSNGKTAFTPMDVE